MAVLTIETPTRTQRVLMVGTDGAFLPLYARLADAPAGHLLAVLSHRPKH